MEITGRVIEVLEPSVFVSKKDNKEYKRYTFVLETKGNYPKKVAFAVLGEEKFAAMGIVVGGEYSVSFDVESRQWKGRWFTEAGAWKAVRIDASGSAAPAQQGSAAPAPAPANGDGKAADDADNLPF